jgi:hypothetical protein
MGAGGVKPPKPNPSENLDQGKWVSTTPQATVQFCKIQAGRKGPGWRGTCLLPPNLAKHWLFDSVKHYRKASVLPKRAVISKFLIRSDKRNRYMSSKGKVATGP